MMKLEAPVTAPGTGRNERQAGAASMHVFQELGRDVVCVHGEIDMATSAHLARVLEAVAHTTAGPCVVLDLRRVRFMDTSGLHAIERARAQLGAERRRLVLRNPARPVRRLLAVAGADDLLAA